MSPHPEASGAGGAGIPSLVGKERELRREPPVTLNTWSKIRQRRRILSRARGALPVRRVPRSLVGGVGRRRLGERLSVAFDPSRRARRDAIYRDGLDAPPATPIRRPCRGESSASALALDVARVPSRFFPPVGSEGADRSRGCQWSFRFRG